MPQTICDEELIALFIRGNYKAWEKFYEEYITHSSFLARLGKKLYPSDKLSFIDYKYIAINNISKSLDKYVQGSGSFFTYWRTIVFTEYQNLVVKLQNETIQISLDEFINFDDKTLTLSDIVGEEDNSLKGNILEKEMENYILEKIKLLNEDEKKALIWMMLGETKRKIQVRLNWSDKIYYKEKNKIQDILNVEIFKNYFK
jgi:hypothetical protein